MYATARGMSKMEPLGGIPNIELMALDITDDSNVSNIVKMIIEKEGHIDIVVNNAGMARFGKICFPHSTSLMPCIGPILEIPMQEISNVFETNVLSMLRVSRAVVAHMSERKSGLIVNICSVMGEMCVSSCRELFSQIDFIVLVLPPGLVSMHPQRQLCTVRAKSCRWSADLST